MRQRGFTYLGIMFVVVLMGIGLAALGELYSTAQRREKEQQLLFAGDQYAKAIKRYQADAKKYPQKLEDLLGDPGQLAVRRYLRKLYPDPITGSPEWGLEKSEDGRIAGVYSKSEQQPLKVANFPERFKAFEDQKKYADWKFLASGPTGKTPAPGTAKQPGQPGQPAQQDQAGQQPATADPFSR